MQISKIINHLTDLRTYLKDDPYSIQLVEEIIKEFDTPGNKAAASAAKQSRGDTKPAVNVTQQPLPTGQIPSDKHEFAE